jgi:hypothetical protein
MSAKMNSKIKRNNFPAGLDKVGGFIEAQGFDPGIGYYRAVPSGPKPALIVLSLGLNGAKIRAVGTIYCPRSGLGFSSTFQP